MLARNVFALILTILGAALPSMSRAEVGQSWPQIPERLRALGVVKIGDLDINELLQAGQNITWRANPGLPPEQLTGNRRSAYYMTATKEVYISQVAATQARKSLPHLELHEAMGALGYHDEDTSLSTALDVISKIEDPQQREQITRIYGEKLFRRDTFKVAGGSSVCGGGDLNALFIKDQVLADLRNSQAGVSLDFLITYPRLNIEPVYQKNVSETSFRYDYKNREEHLTVFVPMNVWQMGREQQTRLLAEIRGDILQLVPQNGKFPAASDASAREVQVFRQQLLSSKKIPGAVSIMFPTLPIGAAPDDAGKRFYICRWKFGATSGSKDYAFEKSHPMNSVVSGQCPDGSFSFITTVVDGGANIRGLSISCGSKRLAAPGMKMEGTLLDLPFNMSCTETFPRN